MDDIVAAMKEKGLKEVSWSGEFPYEEIDKAAGNDDWDYKVMKKGKYKVWGWDEKGDKDWEFVLKLA